jgi:hypothetical protein
MSAERCKPVRLAQHLGFCRHAYRTALWPSRHHMALMSKLRTISPPGVSTGTTALTPRHALPWLVRNSGRGIRTSRGGRPLSSSEARATPRSMAQPLPVARGVGLASRNRARPYGRILRRYAPAARRTAVSDREGLPDDFNVRRTCRCRKTHGTSGQ